MSTVANKIRELLSPDNVAKRLRQSAPTLALYYPGQDWLAVEHNGTIRWLAPDLGGQLTKHPATGETVKADGVTAVQDRYGAIYGEKAEPIDGYYQRRMLSKDGPIEEETAYKAVSFLVTKWQHVGLVMLSGDPEQDKLIKKEAKSMWFKSEVSLAEAETKARLDFVAKWRRENPGRVDIPPPTRAQRRAEELLLMAEAEVSRVDTPYRCQHGCYEGNDWNLFSRHMKVRHAESVNRDDYDKATPDIQIPAQLKPNLPTVNENVQALHAETADPVLPAEYLEEPAKRGPGRPRKTV